jgi:uroporphyrinogen-III synthase
MGVDKPSIYLLSPTPSDDSRVIALPMTTIKYFYKTIDLNNFTALIFTSKHGAKALFKLNSNWNDKKIFVIGDATKNYVESLGFKVYKKASLAYGEAMVSLLEDYKDEIFLYSRPTKVVSDIKALLPHLNIKIEILYESVCTKKIQTVKEDSICIFTSPSVVDCYFKQYTKQIKAIAIGKKTQKRILEYIDSVDVAKTTSIKSCIDFAILYK